MPIYDYQCTACNHRTEVIHGVNESGPAACGACGSGPMRKLFAPPSIVFKGTGWAKKERGSSSAAKGSKSKGSDSAGSSDGGSSGGSGGSGGSGDSGSGGSGSGGSSSGGSSGSGSSGSTGPASGD